ncbi:MAG: methyltransferase [Hyphomicrobiaceae bacterium]
MSGLVDRWLTFRDKLLTSPAFIERAAASPLMRPIARRQARSLFDMCAGFVYSQVLLASVRVGLIDAVRECPLDIATLSGRIGLEPDATQRLVDAAVSLDLLNRRSGGRVGLGMHGAALIANPGIRALVEHHEVLYRDLVDPVALLRGTRGETELSGIWPYARGKGPDDLTDSDVGDYTALMSASQTLIAGQILDHYDVSKHKVLLDVGGGDGTFSCAAARRAAHLQLMLFDLPPVAERARQRFASAGLAERAKAHGGSFLVDELPRGADIATLVRVLHDHDDDAVAKILPRVRNCLAPGGVLLIAEPLADTSGAEPMGGAYFGFYLMAMGSGKPRSFAEISRHVIAAGFRDCQLIKTAMPIQTSLILVRR